MKTNFRLIIQYDKDLGHRFVPNQTACLQYGNRNYFIQTDEHGFRNPSKHLPGQLKILVLGDSYTAGNGISNAKRFTELLEQTYDCQVTNLAVPGYGIDQQVLTYEKYAAKIEHDLVVFIPFLDDLARSCMKARAGTERSTGKYVFIPKPYFELVDEQLELRNVPVTRQRHHVEEMHYIGVGSYQKAAYHKHNGQNGTHSFPQYGNPDSTEWRISKPLIHRLKELTGDKPLLIFPLPMNPSVFANEPPIHMPIFKRFEDKRTFVFDMSKMLHQTHNYETESVYLKICAHFSEGGHQIVAKEIAKVLEAKFDLKKRNLFLAKQEKKCFVLGISCFYHDSAACLLKDGEIIAAAQEERFTRVKHDKSFPLNALNYCLEAGNIDLNDLAAVVYYDHETWTIERVLSNALQLKSGQSAFWKLAQKSLLKKLKLPKIIRSRTGYKGAIFKTQHHVSHAASAYYPSPFKESAILIIDGVGEWACATIAKGIGNKIEVLEQQFYPHSLGLLYSAFTYFTGFKVNSGEYKLMGLAPYGEPVYYDTILEHLVDIKEDGSIRLALEYFAFQKGEQMTNDKFANLFGGPARAKESRITKREMDLAASIQKVTETIVIKMANHAFELTQCDNLVMAGGVALNCVSNGKLFDHTPYKDFYFQPASGDAGGALGCALSWYYEQNPTIDKQASEKQSALLGPSFSQVEIFAFLNSQAYPHHVFEKELRAETIAQFLFKNKVIGYFDDRMEFGPRALGARSILGNPLHPEMQSKLNLKIKYRESFRPFAPIYKEDRTAEYFDFDRPSPHMLIVRKVNARLLKNKEHSDNEDLINIINQERSDIPAITHVDNSARLQSVNAKQNKRMYQILDAFENLSGKGVLINTSFNVRGEPIVCTPQDAYRCFMRTEMDVLVLGDYYLLKEEQAVFQEDENWRDTFALD